MMIKILILVAGFGLSSSSDFFTVVGPRTIQYGTRYSVMFDGSAMESGSVAFFQLNGPQQNNAHVFKPSRKSSLNHYEKINLDIDEKYLKGNFTLKIIANQDKKCKVTDVPIHPIPKSYSVFIQLDKPIYKPNDEVKFRVVLLDHLTKPFTKVDSLHIDITDTNNTKIREFRATRAQINNGIFQDSLDIADEPNVGTWAISVRVNNHDQVTRKEFEVRQYVLPLLDIHIDTNSYVLQSDSHIRTTLSAKYSFGMLARGTAKATANVYDESGNLLHTNVKTVDVVTRKAVDFDVKRELKIEGADSRVIEIVVEFTDELTGKVYSKAKRIEMLTKDTFNITLLRTKDFIRGNDFEFYALVRNPDGRLENTAGIPVNMMCRYTYESSSSGDHEVVQPGFLNNGRVRFSWFVPANVTKMNIRVVYQNSEAEWEVKAGTREVRSESIQATVKPERHTLKEAIVIKISSQSPLDVLNYAVIGRLGLITGDQTYCNYELDCEMIFNADSKMLPEATVIIYYKNAEGKIIYDAVNVKFEGASDNYLNLKVPSTNFRPGQELTVNIESAPSSTVALLGIDESLTYLRKGNDIDHETVMKDLLLYGHTDFLEPLANSIVVENAFIFMEDFKNMHDCTDEELEMLNAHGDLLDERTGEDPEDYNEIEPALDNEDDASEARIRKDFREVFIFDEVKIPNTGKSAFKTTLPDTITTWRISGFSMNLNKGFALAEPVKVTTIQSLFIKLHLPYSIKFGEILKLDVSVFSFIKGKPTNVDVTLHSNVDDVDQLEIMEVTGCRSKVFESDEGTQTKKVKVSKGGSATTTTFYIRPLQSGSIKIKVTATTPKKINDAVERKLLVEHEGTTYYDTKNVICDLTTAESFTKEIEFNPASEIIPDSVKFQALVSGNVVPVMPPPRSKLGREFVQKLVQKPTGCNEQRSRNMGTILYVYKYLKATNQLTDEHKKSAAGWISTGLQAILNFRQKDGSFNLWSNNKNNIWMTAHILKLLGQAEDVSNTIQKSHITGALSYLRDKQDNDGGFSKAELINKFWSSSSLIGNLDKTTFVTVAILENEKYADAYRETISNALNYIHRKIFETNDKYVLAMAAYAFALNGEKFDAETILKKLDEQATVENGEKYWKAESQASSIEIASYAVLAYVTLDQPLEAVPIEKWLIKQGNFYSGRGSTQSTLLATQALAKMAAVKFDSEFAMDLKLTNNLDTTYNFVVDSSNCLDRQVRSLPDETRKVMIDARKRSGKGNGYVSVEYQYTKRESNVSKNFELDIDVRNVRGKQVELEVCASFIGDETVDKLTMTLMEIEAPSGYEFDADTDLKGQNLLGFQKSETKNLKTTIVLYFDSFTETRVCPVVKLIRLDEVMDKKKVSAKIYDYYELKYRATSFYSIRDNAACSV